jgi:hypothetical protein
VTFINSENAHLPEVYGHMEYLLKKYSSFAIKISGYKGIYDAIEHRIKLRNPQTFVWLYHKFNKNERRKHFDFDILNTKWDVLHNDFAPETYQELFDDHLRNCTNQSKEKLLERIDKFKSLTGVSYISLFDLEHDYHKEWVFKILVDVGIINLIAMFKEYVSMESVSKDANNRAKNARSFIFTYIRNYIGEIRTRQAFDFFKQFFMEYNYEDMKLFFVEEAKPVMNGKDFFLDGLYKGYTRYYNERSKEFDISRSFLTEEEHREVFDWIDDYIYQCKAEKYIEFALCTLLNDFTYALLPQNELRRIYDILIATGNPMVKENLDNLKKRFLTEAENEAEKNAKIQEEEKKKQDEIQRRINALNDKMKTSFDGSFKSILKFMDGNRYEVDSVDIVCKIAIEYLSIALTKNNNRVGSNDFGYFLQFCGNLLRKGLLLFEDAKKYISLIEEAEEIVENS